jgi:hypothetical protein
MKVFIGYDVIPPGALGSSHFLFSGISDLARYANSMVLRIASCALLAGAIAFGASDPAYRLLKKILVAGEGNWDYLAIDEPARRLYVSHGPRVEVIDIDTDTPVGKIEGLDGTHGIAIASKLGRGFITSGNTSTVKIFDLKTLKTIADIPAGNGPDGAVFEPVTGRVFAFNHRGGTLTVIQAKDGSVLGHIELGGQPEFPLRGAREYGHGPQEPAAVHRVQQPEDGRGGCR